MQFGVGLLQEGGDDVGALHSAGSCFSRDWTRPLLDLCSLAVFGCAFGLVVLRDRDGTRGIVADRGWSFGLRNFGLSILVHERGVLLVAFGGESYVVELNFVDA